MSLTVSSYCTIEIIIKTKIRNPEIHWIRTFRSEVRMVNQVEANKFQGQIRLTLIKELTECKELF